MENGQWAMEQEVEIADKPKPDNTDFVLTEEEGEGKLSCNQCEYKTEKVVTMKRHITAKHGTTKVSNQKKRKSMESKKVESKTKEVKLDETLSESVMDNFGEEFTSTQIVLEQEEKLMAELEGVMKESTESLDLDEEENEESKVEELEEKLEDEKRKNAMLLGKVNGLEEIKEKQKRNMERMTKIGTDLKAELEKVRASKGAPENAKLKKELKEAKTLTSELQKKVEKLTLEKAKAEAEVTRLLKHNDHLEEALGRTRRQETTQRPTRDCPFWLKGYCSFTEEECNKGRHRKEVFNTKQKMSTISEDKIVSNVLEALNKQQRSQMLQQQQQQTVHQQQPMLPQQQPLLPQQQLMMPQQQQVISQQQQMLPQQQTASMLLPNLHPLGFRQEPIGRRWSHQDHMDMSMSGSSGNPSFMFPQ